MAACRPKVGPASVRSSRRQPTRRRNGGSVERSGIGRGRAARAKRRITLKRYSAKAGSFDANQGLVSKRKLGSQYPPVPFCRTEPHLPPATLLNATGLSCCVGAAHAIEEGIRMTGAQIACFGFRQFSSVLASAALPSIARSSGQLATPGRDQHTLCRLARVRSG
jgi:hypothetical protein